LAFTHVGRVAKRDYYLVIPACLAATRRIFVKFYVGRLAKIVGLRSGLVEIVRKYGQFTRRMLANVSLNSS